MNHAALNICENPECSKMVKIWELTLHLAFKLDSKSVWHQLWLFIHKYLWPRTTIAFLERMNIKGEEERQTPTDLRCCCSSCGHVCDLACTHLCLCLCHMAVPPSWFGFSLFFSFSIVKSIQALFPST